MPRPVSKVKMNLGLAWRDWIPRAFLAGEEERHYGMSTAAGTCRNLGAFQRSADEFVTFSPGRHPER